MAMISKTMDDSIWNQNLGMYPMFEREKIIAAKKKYEHTTGIVEHEDFQLGRKIRVQSTLDNGMLRTQKGLYENDVLAFEYYNINNGTIVDSARRYYPDSKLYSRRVIPVESSKEVYEEYHTSGKIRSRSERNQLLTWHENGNQSGAFVFEKGEVAQRTLWYVNGQKKEESRWRNDTMIGQYKEWDSLGHQIRNKYFVKGAENK